MAAALTRGRKPVGKEVAARRRHGGPVGQDRRGFLPCRRPPCRSEAKTSLPTGLPAARQRGRHVQIIPRLSHPARTCSRRRDEKESAPACPVQVRNIYAVAR